MSRSRTSGPTGARPCATRSPRGGGSALWVPVDVSDEDDVRRSLGETAAAARLVRSVPGLTLTLDYTHFTRCGIPDAEVEPLIAHASHFHARCARDGRLQASFQENTIDYARVLDVMRQVGYSGYVGVEYVWIDWEHCNEVDNLSETVLLRDHLRSRATPA